MFRSRLSTVGKQHDCVYPSSGPNGGNAAEISIGPVSKMSMKELRAAALIGKENAKDVPGLATNAYIVKVGATSQPDGYEVGSKHVTGRLLITRLFGPSPGQLPTEDAAIDWHKAVANSI